MNRILKDTIWTSRSLAELDDFTQDQFPRWLLMADDWGCFDVDPDVIKGLVYPKRPKVTVKIIEKVRTELYDSGHLFCWSEGDHVWGYWVSWGNHNYCSSGAVDDEGNRAKRRRKTPEPPPEELKLYLQQHKKVSEQFGTSRNKSEHGGTKVSMHDPDLDSDSDLNACISLANASVSTGVDASAVSVTPAVMIEAYRELRGELPDARLTPEREKKCRARIRSHARDPASFLEDWKNSVVKAARSKFCCGGGSSGWVADFGFFIENDTNFRKVLEGKYDDRKRGVNGAHLDSETRGGEETPGSTSERRTSRGDPKYIPRQ